MQPDEIQDNDRSYYLEVLFAEGMELADYNSSIWKAAAIKCLELSQDKEAQDSFTLPLPLPRGVRGCHMGKAAELFSEWFNADSDPSVFELFSLFEFSRVSNEKAKAIYADWQEHSRSWAFDEVIERVEAKGARKTKTTGIDFDGETRFLSKDGLIKIKPNGLAMLGLSNGKYRIRMKRLK